MKLTAVLLVGFCVACGSDGDASLPPTTDFDPDAPTTIQGTPPPTVGPETERPAIVPEESIGYVLDNGLILWVDPPIGRVVGGNGECDDLIGPPDAFYDRYNEDTVPGFEGIVCYREDAG